jgi:hypothetical protein
MHAMHGRSLLMLGKLIKMHLQQIMIRAIITRNVMPAPVATAVLIVLSSFLFL